MIIRIKFGDNDFAHHFEKAALDIYHSLCRGEDDLLEARGRAFREFRALAEKDLDVVVNMVLLTAYGHYVAQLGARRMFLEHTRLLERGKERKEISYYLEDAEATMRYWAKHLKVQFTKNEYDYDSFRALIDDDWENSEVVYIDFHTGEVIVK